MRITSVETARRVVHVAMAALLAAGGAGGLAVGMARSQAAVQPPAQAADPLNVLVQQESETQTNLTAVLQRLAIARSSKATYEIQKAQADAALKAAEAVTKSRRDEVKGLKPAVPVTADSNAEWQNVGELKTKLEKRAVEVRTQLAAIADWERTQNIILVSPRQSEKELLEFEDKILSTGFSDRDSIDIYLRGEPTRRIWDDFWSRQPPPYNDGNGIKDKLVGGGFIRYLTTEVTRLIRATPQPAPPTDPNAARLLQEAEKKLAEAENSEGVAARRVAALDRELDRLDAGIKVVEAEAAVARTNLDAVRAQIKAMRDQRAQAALAEQKRLEAEENALYAEVKALIDQARGQLVAEGPDGKQLRVSFRSHDEAAETIKTIATKVTECRTKQFNRTFPNRTEGWCDQARTLLEKLRTAHTGQQKKLTEMKSETQDLVRQATAACGIRDHKVCARLLTAAYRSVQPCMNTADPACLKAAAKIVVVLHYLYPIEQRERLNRALGVSSILLESQGMAVYKLKSCRISDKRLFGDNLVTSALTVQIQSVVLGSPTATSGQTVPLKLSYAVAGLDNDETFPADVVVTIAGAGGTRQVINGTDLKLGSGRFDYSFGIDATLAAGAYTVSAAIKTVEHESNRAEASLAIEGAGTTRGLSAQPACQMTYRISPSNATLYARFFKPDLSDDERRKLAWTEEKKYGGGGYRPTGEPATNNLNCAGYVLRYLLPVIQGGNVDVGDFYTKILAPYAEQRWQASEQCVVLYRDINGNPAHYAFVLLDPQTRRLGIRSKDNHERPHFGPLPPIVNLLSNDALIRAFPGRTEYYWMDRSKFTIEPISNTCNAQPGDGASTSAWAGTYMIPELRTTSDSRLIARSGGR